MLRSPQATTLAATAIAAAIAACGGDVPRPRDRAADPVRYVGAAACTTCHVEIARSFARTGMGRSLYPMEGPGARDLARFPDTVEMQDPPLRYSVFEEEGRFHQKQFRIDERGREIDVDVREIRYVIGSGNHSRSFATEHEGRLYQMPLCWYPEADLWDLCPGYEIRNEHFRRKIDETCLFCHNGRVVRSERFGNLFEDPFPHGIGCERCHGPGSRHVARWTGSPAPAAQGRGDDTIVNPARLPPERSVEICMQCHLGDSRQTERVMHDRARMAQYRPGEPLQNYLAVYVYRQKLPGVFGLTAQADRMVLSRCYTASKGALQCISCHDPHREVYEVSREDPGHFNGVCAGCHAEQGCTGPVEQRGGDCVACHMRRAEPHDQRYTTFLDHWIRRRPEDGIDRRRDDYTLVPFFPDHDAYGTPSERSLALGRAYLNKKIATHGTGPMPWALGLEALEQAVRLDPQNAAAHFFLGKTEMSRGRPDLAGPHFRRAADIDPGYVEALQELGSSLLYQGRLEEAATVLARALEIGPRGDDVGAVLNEIARLEMERGRLDEARSRLEEALRIEPIGHEILANRGLVEALDGRHQQAVTWFSEALRYAPGHPQILRYLARSVARSDR